MIGQIAFNSGRLRANGNVSGKLGMELAIAIFYEKKKKTSFILLIKLFK